MCISNYFRHFCIFVDFSRVYFVVNNLKMAVIKRIVKPKSHKGKKILSKREPQAIEDPKTAILIKGQNSSQLVFDCMKDLYALKKPGAIILKGKANDIKPFEDPTPIEKFSSKHNAALFMYTSHNKKRPHNLVMGRTYEHTLLDMVEFGVEKFKSLQDFKVEKISTGIKPLLLFEGELFEHNSNYIKIKNLLTDMFLGENADNVRLQGLEHILTFTAHGDRIYFRSYRIMLKKSGTRIPNVKIEEIGPRMNLMLRRTQLSSDELFKKACKKPKELKAKKKKNITSDAFSNTLARIHVGDQNLKSIQTRKMKGLKKPMSERKAERKRKNEASEAESSPKKIRDTEKTTV